MPTAHTAQSARCPLCGASARPEPAMAPAPLLRCADCRFMFLDRDAASYGDDYFAAYDGDDYVASERRRRHESRRRVAFVRRHVPPPARILEVGAAAGFFLDEMRRAGYGVTGVELNAEMARHARERLGLEVHAGRVEDVQVPDGAFDAACAWHVVEHLEDPVGALAGVRAALRPGGALLLEVPNAESAVARRHGARWSALQLPYHVGHHGPASMRTLLDRAGLELVEVATVPFAHYAGDGSLGGARRLAQAAREVVRGRGPVALDRHPSGHQLLRAVARRPAT